MWTKKQSRKWIEETYGKPDAITLKIMNDPTSQTYQLLREMDRRERRMARGREKRRLLEAAASSVRST